jgi:glycosyltransferase involved in cell wall biosynthesis
MKRPERDATIRYIAQDAQTGYGDAADRLVRALRAAGARIEYRGWRGLTNESDTVGLRPFSRDPRPDDLAVRGAPTIVHLVPEHYPDVIERVDGPLISHTVWETDKPPQHWSSLFDLVERVIIPTEWNRQVFETHGVRPPVVVVPHVVCDPVPGDGGVQLGLPDDVVVFYTISRWDERKQPAAVIRAFLDAFTADDRVALVVKTSSFPQYPVRGDWGQESQLIGTTMLEVARIIKDYPRPPLVKVEIDEWAPARIAGLHERGDCFVSLSHAEGWDLPAFDATAYGNAVVATGWGAPLDFLREETSSLVEYDLVPVRHFEPQSYSPDQHWAEPRHEHAVELMREVARDAAAARRRAAPARADVLERYAPSRVVETLADVVPELGFDFGPGRSRARPAAQPKIPRIVHFCFGMQPAPQPLHLVHYLAVRSCLEHVQPDEAHLHCRHLPTGPYWDLVEPLLTVHHVEPVKAVSGRRYADRMISRYLYAHHADFVRLDALSELGGLYADLDTLFVASIPDALWHMPFVIGREDDVFDPAIARGNPALSNAIMMSAPSSPFVETWRAEIEGALDGSWAAHSCFLAHDLAERMPAEVHVEPRRTFHAFAPSPAGIALMLEHPPPDLDGVVAMHLAAHLWWEEKRRDFSAMHEALITEDWVRSSPSTYATCARPFLPNA